MAAAEYSYYPFQANWWHRKHWHKELLRSPRGVPVALRGYRRILTDEVIFSQSWAQHPLVQEYRNPGNRWRMLETGLVLAQLPTIAEYKPRLLLPRSYGQACAELRAALLLQRLGLRVQRDPANVSADVGPS